MNGVTDDRYRGDIDGLRAIAVLAVVGFHAEMPHLSGGFVGVDIFFVISGFLITQVITREVRTGTFSLLTFYERRMRRIMPALSVMLVSSAIMAIVVDISPSSFRRLSSTIITTTVFSSNILFWMKGSYFGNDAVNTPLLHTWTLGVEEQFYIIYPLIILILFRFSKRWALVGIALLFATSLTLALWVSRFDFDATFYLLPFRAWELLLGSLLALIVTSPPPNRAAAYTAGFLGLMLILYPVLTFTADLRPRSLVIPCCGTALLIYGNAGPTTLIGATLASRPMRFIGLISYSLYLWHWPLLAFGPLVAPPFRGGPLLSGFLMAGALLAAVASYQFVERPFRRPNGVLTRPYLFLMVAAAALAFVGLGLAGYFSRGWPSRFNPSDRALLAYEDYWLTEAWKSGAKQDTCFVDEVGYRQDLCFMASPNRPTLLMWGDSHSADLAKSVRELMEPVGTQVAQATMGGCSPVLQPSKAMKSEDSCADFNERIFSLVEKYRPETVVLSGRWEQGEEYFANLRNTILKLSHLRSRVIVVGPVMEYEKDLPYILMRHRRSAFPLDSVQRNELFEEDANLERLVADTKAGIYISVLTPLCPNRICPVWARNSIPMEFDGEGHLTYEGSQVVVREALAKALEAGR